MTVDIRKADRDIVDQEVANHMIGKYPYETTVYRLVDIAEPVSPFEELIGDSINVNEYYRRDFDLGDLYLSRSKTAEGAALEHDFVVSGIKDGTINMMTYRERMAVYGPGDTIDGER